MRCDWPVGYNEDCIEPPCEIFLQLFIENGEMAADGIPLDDHDFPPENGGDESYENGGDEGYENDSEPIQIYGPFPIDDDDLSDGSDDFLSYHSSDPSMHTISDASIPGSTGESSSDEGEAESEPQCESNNDEHGIRNSLSDLSQYSEESWYPENVSNEESEHNEESDVFMENDPSDEASSSVNDQRSENCDEACSNLAYQEIGNCEAISSNDLPLSSEMSHAEESSVKLETSSGNNGLLPSTYVSLYVVVPPTNFSNESGSDLLPGVSSDRLFSGLIPLNPPCSPASLISDNENIQSDDVSMQNSSKISKGLDELTSDTPALCNSTSAEEDDKKYHSLSEFDSVLENSNCIISDSKSETTCSFNDNLHAGFSTYDANLSEGSDLALEDNASNEILSDKSVPSLKRKVCSSIDDNVVNKVPKYTSSQTSNESVNQGSLDNYCKVLSNNSEKPTPHEEEKMDIVTPVVAAENVILTLGKAVEDTSVVNEKPKSR